MLCNNETMTDWQEEKFDPTWHWNFAWGVDGKTGHVYAWKLKGDTDGQVEHRKTLEGYLGREVQVRQGDDMGLATYIPAEEKLDGTLVAPPHVICEAYYGVPVPDAVHEYFEEQYPGAVVRDAATRIGRMKNRNLPLTPLQVAEEEEPDPEVPDAFSTDPKQLVMVQRDPAKLAAWLKETFPIKVVERKVSRWEKLTGWLKKRSGADKEGAMVAFFIPEEVGKKIQVDGGEPLKDLHITLAYFVDAGADRDDWDDAKEIVKQFADQYGSFEGEVGGFGIFQNEEDVLWASCDIPGINQFHHELVEALDDAGFEVSKEHSFTPHISTGTKETYPNWTPS